MDNIEFKSFINEFNQRMQEEVNRGMVEMVLEAYEHETDDQNAGKVIRCLMDNGCPPSAIIKTIKKFVRELNNGTYLESEG